MGVVPVLSRPCRPQRHPEASHSCARQPDGECALRQKSSLLRKKLPSEKTPRLVTPGRELHRALDQTEPRSLVALEHLEPLHGQIRGLAHPGILNHRLIRVLFAPRPDPIDAFAGEAPKPGIMKGEPGNLFETLCGPRPIQNRKQDRSLMNNGVHIHPAAFSVKKILEPRGERDHGGRRRIAPGPDDRKPGDRNAKRGGRTKAGPEGNRTLYRDPPAAEPQGIPIEQAEGPIQGLTHPIRAGSGDLQGICRRMPLEPERKFRMRERHRTLPPQHAVLAAQNPLRGNLDADEGLLRGRQIAPPSRPSSTAPGARDAGS